MRIQDALRAAVDQGVIRPKDLFFARTLHSLGHDNWTRPMLTAGRAMLLSYSEGELGYRPLERLQSVEQAMAAQQTSFLGSMVAAPSAPAARGRIFRHEEKNRWLIENPSDELKRKLQFAEVRAFKHDNRWLWPVYEHRLEEVIRLAGDELVGSKEILQ